MPTSYFGLICPHCNAGYPLGRENTRDWRPGIANLRFRFKGQWELHCIRCNVTSYFGDFQRWSPHKSYTAAQMATAGLHVRRVPSARAKSTSLPV